METQLRQISYKRYEYTNVLAAREQRVQTSSLLTFVYDIPYFDACGIFPPLHIANQIFIEGKAGGGMSPGTRWKPFSISEAEYAALVDAVQQTPIAEIKQHARYAFVQMMFDHSLDSIPQRDAWFSACCSKHRDSWHERLRESGALE